MRPWIKVRLPDIRESHQAATTVEGWREARELPRHFARAILLYAGLLRGNTDLLREYFPFIAAQPSPAAARPNRGSKGAKIEYVGRSDKDQLLEALDVGFDALEID